MVTVSCQKVSHTVQNENNLSHTDSEAFCLWPFFFLKKMERFFSKEICIIRACEDWFRDHRCNQIKCILTRQDPAFLSFFFFGLFRATPAAYGGSQARDQIRATSAIYTTGHSNAKSLVHWARLGIEPVSSWILKGSLSLSTTGLLVVFYQQDATKAWDNTRPNWLDPR